MVDDFADVEKILIQCVLWREAITEQPVDLSFVKSLREQLTTRKDLWKYFQVTYYHVKDWKNTPIKKVPKNRIPNTLRMLDTLAFE